MLLAESGFGREELQDSAYPRQATIHTKPSKRSLQEATSWSALEEMHELSLFGQVPLARHEQVLHILAGLSAMQPQSIYERHLIFQPLRSLDQNKINKKLPNKPVQNQPTAFVQLVNTLQRNDFDKAAQLFATEDSENAQHSSALVMRVQEIPEPETKALVLRKVIQSSVEKQDIEQYLDQTKFKFVNEFVVEGHRLICRDIVLTLHRILYVQPTEPPHSGPQTYLPQLDQFELLDGSGTFVLEACIRIDDRTKPALVQTATEQLLWFRNEMKGSVDLRPPERLALDTRVRDI